MKHVYMLFAAIALEVTGTTFMKFSVMHEWFIGYPVMLLLMGFSYFCLSKAVKKYPSALPTQFGKALALWALPLLPGLFLTKQCRRKSFLLLQLY